MVRALPVVWSPRHKGTGIIADVCAVYRKTAVTAAASPAPASRTHAATASAAQLQYLREHSLPSLVHVGEVHEDCGHAVASVVISGSKGEVVVVGVVLLGGLRAIAGEWEM